MSLEELMTLCGTQRSRNNANPRLGGQCGNDEVDNPSRDSLLDEPTQNYEGWVSTEEAKRALCRGRRLERTWQQVPHVQVLQSILLVDRTDVKKKEEPAGKGGRNKEKGGYVEKMLTPLMRT